MGPSMKKLDLSRFLIAWLFGFSSVNAATITSLDEIAFWTGSGENRAAIVIDWDGESSADESLAWGYRWDGEASGEDMLRAVLASDARLFAKLGASSPSGVATYGFGYDLDNDSEFGITDSAIFNLDGIAISGPPDDPPPAAMATDSEDLYAEGWFTGFWRYGLSNGNPFLDGGWTNSGVGMSSRTLTDGDWDSWAFTPTFSLTAFAENAIAATAPGLAGDFDSDQDVDGADFLVWQRNFGISSDVTDLQQWSSNFGFSWESGGLLSAALSVPELPSSLLALEAIGFSFFASRFTTRRRL